MQANTAHPSLVGDILNQSTATKIAPCLSYRRKESNYRCQSLVRTPLSHLKPAANQRAVEHSQFSSLHPLSTDVPPQHDFNAASTSWATQADNANNDPVQPERPLGAVGGDKKQLCVGTELPWLAAKTCWCMLLWGSGKDYGSFVEADRQHFPFFHVIVTHKGSECSPDEAPSPH